MPYMLFTGLDDYRARGSDATPFLTVTHYTEFSESKGLVLVRGDVVLTSKLSDKEVRTFSSCRVSDWTKCSMQQIF